MSEPIARQFREILLWPLQLMPLDDGRQIQRHADILAAADTAWKPLPDEFARPGAFAERYYTQFVTFLPQVQRFLFGEAGAHGGYGERPIRQFRRHDIRTARLWFRDRPEPVILDVVQLDLYFFYDIDVVILAFEVAGRDLALSLVQDLLHRFGRCYPPAWEPDGSPAQSLAGCEWLDAAGQVLAASDARDKTLFLDHVRRHRAPRFAAHWQFLLQPLVPHDSDATGELRVRQLEYHRLPLMAWLAFDEPRRLTRGDLVRLGLLAGPGPSDTLPYSASYLADFEAKYSYQRYHRDHTTEAGPETRFLGCGHAFLVIGDAADAFCTDAETGLLAQFRKQYFLIGLIAHFHKAALLMLSDRLVSAINRLDIDDITSTGRFQRSIRHTLEIFLRFTHRYWFHEISDQVLARDLFAQWSHHLGTDRLYAEVREETEDMAGYIDSDGLRRQADTVVRLTVVTTFGLIGTVASGILGMNVFDLAADDWPARIGYVTVSLIPVAILTIYTIVKAQRLAGFLEALSDERVTFRAKAAALAKVWRRGRSEGI